jgi:hypothetical protein
VRDSIHKRENGNMLYMLCSRNANPRVKRKARKQNMKKTDTGKE